MYIKYLIILLIIIFLYFNHDTTTDDTDIHMKNILEKYDSK